MSSKKMQLVFNGDTAQELIDATLDFTTTYQKESAAKAAAVASSSPASTPAPAATKPAGGKKEKAAESKSEAPTVSADDVKKAMKAVQDKYEVLGDKDSGMAKVKELLGQFKVKKFTELTPDLYPAVVATAQGFLDAAPAASAADDMFA